MAVQKVIDCFYRGYVRCDGKKAIEKFKGLNGHEKPPEGDYAGILALDTVLIDVDDRQQAKKILAILKANKIRCRVYKSTRGAHILLMNNKDHLVDSAMTHINLACGIISDIKVGVKKNSSNNNCLEFLRVDGCPRELIYDSGAPYDEVPVYLLPIPRPRDKALDCANMVEGDGRNSALSTLMFCMRKYLQLSDDEIRETAQIINDYVFEQPLSDEEYNTITRDETFENMDDADDLDDNGKKKITLKTFNDFINCDGLKIRYDELQNIIEYDHIPATYEALKDQQNNMPVVLQDRYKAYVQKQSVTLQTVKGYISVIADVNSFNPVRDYLTGATWDGADRFDDIFSVLHVTDDFEKALIRKWFIQAAAMPFNELNSASREPAFQPEGVLILQGSEGIGKSRFFQLITPNPLWFKSLDHGVSTYNKDDKILLTSAWIAEIGEIDRTFRENRSDIKGFITQATDTIRKPYRPEQVEKARTSTFCGSTNENEFLTTDSGFRRWWIIPIDRDIDQKKLIEMRSGDELHQLWLECFALWSADHDSFRLSASERQALERMNLSHMALPPGMEELLDRCDFDAPQGDWQWLTPSQIIKIYEYGVTKYTPAQIGKALTTIVKLNYGVKKEAKKSRVGWRYLIPPEKPTPVIGVFDD